MKLPRCLLCHSVQTTQLPSRLERTVLWRCQQCGLRFLHPQPNIVEAIYDDDYLLYYGSDKQSQQSLRAVKDRTYQGYLRRLEQWRMPGKILDVGCAVGLFLESAKMRGWDPYGIEVAAFGRETQKKFGQRRIKLESLRNGIFPKKMFDAITFLDVLEHTQNPVKSVEIAYTLLRPGGIIAIVTPDIGSASAQLMGKYWNHYHLDHLFYFQRQTIQLLLEQAEFTVRSIRPTTKRFNLASIAGYFESYPTPLFTPLAQMVYSLTPQWFREVSFPFRSGSLFAVGQKE